MATRVQLPDGNVGEFPDSMSPAAIAMVLRKQYPPDYLSGRPGMPKPPNPIEKDMNDPSSPYFQGGMPGSFEGHPENVGEYIPRTVGEMAGGAADIARGDVARGAHRIISGAGEATLPVAAMVAPAAPLATAKVLAGGAAGAYGAGLAADVAGASEDQRALAGDVGAIIGGGIGSKVSLPGAATKEVSKTVARSVLSRIPVIGDLVKRPTVADYLEALRAKGVPEEVIQQAPLLRPEELDQFNQAAGIRPEMTIPK
jgi:hypothetical protein